MMPVGTRVAHMNELWRIAAVILVAGERCYSLLRWDGHTATVPVTAFAGRAVAVTPPDGAPHAFR